ncbi:ABC transporter permease [Streptomyces sp. NPDC088789]|uniref:ABC transporter permease n=1 Tax=Streptomyces sp. NPDC088789 TaxID=3365899 RepID=UPI0037F7125E
MNFVKRACLSLWARKVRTLVTLATFLVISVMVLGGVLIRDATARAGERAERTVGADVTLEMDLDSLASGGALTAPRISAGLVDRIGTSPLVESYNYQSFDGARLAGGAELTGESADPGRPGLALPRGVRDSRLVPGFADGSWTLLAGEPITAADRDRDVVLIEERLARKNRLEPGDTLRLAPNDPEREGTRQFTVRGVYRDPSDAPDPEYLDSPGDRILMPAHALTRLNGGEGGATEVGGAVFKLKDPGTYDAFTASAKERAGAALDGFTLGINDKAVRQMTGAMSAVSSSATLAMWLIGVAGASVLALLVTLAVRQRGREYGVLLALGEGRGKVVAQQAVEIVAVAAVAVGLSCLFAAPLTQSAGNALVSGEAAEQRRKLDAWEPPPPGQTGVDQGLDPEDRPVEGADPIDRITVRLDDGALITVVGAGLGIALLAAVAPAAAVLRLDPKTILTKGT